MSKPRRGTEQVFYDTFADWDAADQAAALKVLEVLHRQKRRDRGFQKIADNITGQCAHGVPIDVTCGKCEELR